MLLLVSRALLLGMAVLGWFALHKFTKTNGLFPMMAAAHKRGKIPGGPAYNTEFTGVEALDEIANILVQFFWPAVDGNNLDTALAAAVLAAQGVAAFTLTVLEGLRHGNAGRIISFTTFFGMLIQLFGFGFIGPIYLLIHLLSVPLASGVTAKSLAIPEVYLREIPIAQALGFFLPSIVMSLPAPSMLDVSTKIAAILAWQFFPIWSALLLEVLARLRSSSKSSSTSPASTIDAQRRLYRGALYLSAGVHMVILAASVFSIFRPDIIGHSHARYLHPIYLYIPPNPFSAAKASDIAEGAFWFLQWDTANTTISYLIWAVCVKYSAFKEISPLMVLRDLVVRPILLGPASAALLLVWERDELILATDQKTVAKKLK